MKKKIQLKKVKKQKKKEHRLNLTQKKLVSHFAILNKARRKN
jgi:hypothetical protein